VESGEITVLGVQSKRRKGYAARRGYHRAVISPGPGGSFESAAWTIGRDGAQTLTSVVRRGLAESAEGGVSQSRSTGRPHRKRPGMTGIAAASRIRGSNGFVVALADLSAWRGVAALRLAGPGTRAAQSAAPHGKSEIRQPVLCRGARHRRNGAPLRRWSLLDVRE
jgi:hypothetical protein